VKEAAWKFVTFLSSQEGMESMALLKLGMPANKSVCYRADLYLKPPPYNLEVFAEGMNIACCNDLRFVRLWLEWVNALQSPIELALLGEMSVEEACATIDEDCDEVLARS
jgi:ABC-type glycerol-3-phosphate transport system substrate-binding protein